MDYPGVNSKRCGNPMEKTIRKMIYIHSWWLFHIDINVQLIYVINIYIAIYTKKKHECGKRNEEPLYTMFANSNGKVTCYGSRRISMDFPHPCHTSNPTAP
jgi:hypothetical protein